nr:site-specific integrase [Lachnospiraceae bacterium]
KTDKLVCKPTKRHDGYTRQEITALRGVLEKENSPYARIVRLDMCLTVRIGELIAIKWKDVDLEGRRLHITAQIVRKKRNGKQSFEYVHYTKGNKYVDDENSKGCRWVNLNDRAVEVLKEQRKANPFGEYVFVSQAGTALIADKVNEHLQTYCEKAGIRYRSTHSIRVANITALYDSGVAPTKIQIAAGHSDIRTTNGYCRSEICDEIDGDTLNRAL